MQPILLDFPDEFETKRLLIRMPLPGDGKVVFKAIEASKQELRPWMPFALNDQTEEETEINIREAHIRFLERSDLRLLVFKKDTGEFVGSSGLHRIDWKIPKFEIGYWIDSRYSGQGFMTEAVEGITSFAVQELKAKRVEIRMDPLNKKSRAVAERSGFQLEGILRNEGLSVDGSDLRDTCIFAKIF